MFKKLIAFTAHFLMRLRYRIKVTGLKELEGTKGHLVIPNHVSLMEPVVIGTILWSTLAPRPVITQPFFDLQVFKFIFKRMRAISAPNFIIGSNLEKVVHLETCLKEVLDGLEQGDNVLFYPAGRIKVQEEEKVDGSSGVYRLLQKRNELDVVFVRITGLWGSSFSNAVHGKTPHIIKELLKAGLKILANFIFFMPRRDVEIVFEKGRLKLSDHRNKRDLNQSLETWYNFKKDPFYSPPYHFLFRNKPLKRVLYSPPVSISNPGILQEVLDCIELIVGRKVGPKEHLAYDLSLDSLQISELFVLLQGKYDLRDLYTTELATAEHIVAMIEGSWIPKRLAHELHKQEKKAWKFFKKKMPCLDEVFGPISLDAIGERIAAWKEVFEKEVSEKVHLLIGSGVEAYAAAVGAFYAKKLPTFVKPDEVGLFERVFTTKETIVRWHAPNRIQGSLVYLPEQRVSAKWYWLPIPKEDEALTHLQDKSFWVNNFFQIDPLLFVAMTHHALREKIQVALPFSGIPNLSWSRRVAQIAER